MALELSEGAGPDSAKNWDFPKVHFQLHLFDDIMAKDVTRNFNTKTNESLNRPFKEDYTITNHQRVEKQVCAWDTNIDLC